MTYTIMNVVTGEVVTILNSKAEVQNWFSRLARLKDLNVTGKDMKSACTGMPYIKFYVCDWSLYHTLRRYQVIDEEGRSVDPRIWESEASGEVCGQDVLRINWSYHRRFRGHGNPPSLIRQAKREACADVELEVRPVRANIKIRTKKYDTSKLFRSEEWKCWKNKKAARQWGKHKESFVRPAKLADVLMPVEEIDAMDWATVGIIDEVLLQNIENLEQLICDRITELDSIPDEVISEAECREIELLRLLNPLEDIQCHGDCRNMSIYFTDNEDIYRTYLAEEIEMLEYCAKPVMF